ncbi:T-cell activation Rho GTPase activating protein, putative [Entamoeba dispar SAW760]|uniref:T-cell activation Rho GTPase activating protein, putative n=1 Tax=Entamoeba dispar (strain ATCC PRA-260 / SAW760) TaxID=370354 RepID=B0EV54_ENTDS|nr:T-cell activation Rho GTPase activating protein, putative [Entamoeba dispar SAW760]EDR21594.1 T-cell activation Rho GTPase activating protein, putative [Entamoeba dispar SAW760]|eukprot:EDR21594.1 T-cell activation Rho GTPase activating protein, putative [Entamoeba dispar SAW760]
MTFHCKKDKGYIEEYQRCLNETLKNIQVFSDSLQPIIIKTSSISDQFNALRKELKEDKKDYNHQLGILYIYHIKFNIEGFKIIKQISEASFNLFKNGGTIWGNININKLVRCSEREIVQYNMIKDKQFIEYYGNSLDIILQQEKRTSKQLPEMIEVMILLILETGMDFKGIFRFSPYANLKEIEEGTRRISVTDISEYSVDIIACLLKCFLQKMPTHIIDTMKSLEMISIFLKNKTESIELKRKLYKKIIFSLPDANITLLMNLCYLCNEINKKKELNGMSSKNLGVVLAPSILTLPDPEFLANSNIDPNTGKEVGYGIDILTFLIDEYPMIFKEELEKHERELVTLGSIQIQRSQSPSLSFKNKKIYEKKISDKAIPSIKHSEIKEIHDNQNEKVDESSDELPVVTTATSINFGKSQRNNIITRMDNPDEIKFGKFTPGLDSSSQHISSKEKRVILRSDRAHECIKVLDQMKQENIFNNNAFEQSDEDGEKGNVMKLRSSFTEKRSKSFNPMTNKLGLSEVSLKTNQNSNENDTKLEDKSEQIYSNNISEV